MVPAFFFTGRRPPAKRPAAAPHKSQAFRYRSTGATNRRDGGAIAWRLEDEIVGYRLGCEAIVRVRGQLHRVIARDLGHSESEERFYCFGKVQGGVLTVRFTYRGNLIRIIGAGYWRKGKQIYDKENNLLG